MTSLLTLHDFLKEEFGVDIPIFRGNGRSIDDPYEIESDGTHLTKDYTSIEYSVIKCLCELQQAKWKIVQQRLISYKGKKIDSMQVEVQLADKEFGTYKKETQTYFFDITDCLTKPKASLNTSQSNNGNNFDNNGVSQISAQKPNIRLGEFLKMESRFKKKVVKFALVTIIIMGLFPPWSYVAKFSTVYSVKPATYSFLFSPPKPEKEGGQFGVKLDLSRLLLQWFLVIVFAGTLIYVKHENDD